MRMRKSYRYLADDERFDIESDSSKVSQLHAEKLVDNKYDAYKPQAYRTKLNKQESRQERCGSEKLSEKSNDDNLSVEGCIEKYSGGKYKVTSLNSVQVIVPLDATPEEVKEAFEKAFRLL